MVWPHKKLLTSEKQPLQKNTHTQFFFFIKNKCERVLLNLSFLRVWIDTSNKIEQRRKGRRIYDFYGDYDDDDDIVIIVTCMMDCFGSSIVCSVMSMCWVGWLNSWDDEDDDNEYITWLYIQIRQRPTRDCVVLCLNNHSFMNTTIRTW